MTIILAAALVLTLAAAAALALAVCLFRYYVVDGDWRRITEGRER